MTDLLIKPCKLKGTVKIPPSKSMAHRTIIAASLAKGNSVISNVELSDDIQATITGMESFGAVILIEEVDERFQLKIKGIGDLKNKANSGRLIDANESGSTLRFLVPLATLFEGETRFIGRGKLGTRPMTIYEEIFDSQGLLYQSHGQKGQLDLLVGGTPLKAGLYELPGDVSSQFITGLLYTLPLLKEDSKLRMTTSIESLGYLKLTLAVLKLYGIEINYDGEAVFSIKGNQSYQPANYQIEGDFSQAAFFLVAGALGNEVKVEGLDPASEQGDKEIIDILKGLNAELVAEKEIMMAKSNHLESSKIIIDGAQVPDIIPITALAACLTEGETRIINLERLRIKESDRLEATQTELTKLGAKIKVEEDSLVIQGIENKLAGDTQVWSHQDHRMAMMLAIASTVCEKDIILKDAECVSKSYPTFWEDFVKLGGQVSEWNVG